MFYEVIIDSGETPNKCTIAPLAYRTDFRLFRVGKNRPLGPLRASLLLHPDGESLVDLRGTLAPIEGLACVDCVWRRLSTLVTRIEGTLPKLVRIPDGFETAYPRHSVKNTDPAGGLATIEAIFVAAALLGHWDASLLSEYYFGRKFVEINAQRFLELGVSQAGDTNAVPLTTPRQRNSEQRKRDRGRY